MISISHWGMFPEARRQFTVPAGFRLPSGDEVDAEMMRTDGIIRLISVEERQANQSLLRKWWNGR